MTIQNVFYLDISHTGAGTLCPLRLCLEDRRHLNNTKNIIFLGFVFDLDKFLTLKNANFFVFSSLNRNFILSLHHQNIVELKNNGMNNIESSTGEIVMYQPDETIRLEVRVEDDTVWLNRQQMATLFGRDVKTIGKHVNNALHEELANVPTVANFAIVQNEGGRIVNRTIEFYSIDMIMSVGYRVKSEQGIKFRRWLCRAGDYVKLKGCSIYFCNPFLINHFT